MVTSNGNDLWVGVKARYVSCTIISCTFKILNYHVVHNRTRTNDEINIITVQKDRRVFQYVPSAEQNCVHSLRSFTKCELSFSKPFLPFRRRIGDGF